MIESALRHVFDVPQQQLHFDPADPGPAADGRPHDTLARRVGTCERAFVGGFFADRIGYAFAAGYGEALAALFPADAPVPAAFAVTEAGGGSPRAMQTRLTWSAAGTASLDGEKTFVTLGAAAERIYVVASEGVDDAGRNRLRVVRVSARSPGLSFAAGPALSIVPEVAHAHLTLRGVTVTQDDVLTGDGYVTYVKPFRTVEDIHVHAALVGHLLRVARAFQLPAAFVADLVATFVQLHALAGEPPLAATTHVALAGVLTGFERLLTTHHTALQQVPEPVRGRTQRDLALRLVAGKARQKRLEAAMVVLGLGH